MPIADASTNYLNLPPVRSATELYLVSPKNPDFATTVSDKPFFSKHTPEYVPGHDARNSFYGLYTDNTAEDIAPNQLVPRRHRLFDRVVRGLESLRGRKAATPLGQVALTNTPVSLSLRLL